MLLVISFFSHENVDIMIFDPWSRIMKARPVFQIRQLLGTHFCDRR
jgi:hypothetical protein